MFLFFSFSLPHSHDLNQCHFIFLSVSHTHSISLILLTLGCSLHSFHFIPQYLHIFLPLSHTHPHSLTRSHSSHFLTPPSTPYTSSHTLSHTKTSSPTRSLPRTDTKAAFLALLHKFGVFTLSQVVFHVCLNSDSFSLLVATFG